MQGQDQALDDVIALRQEIPGSGRWPGSIIENNRVMNTTGRLDEMLTSTIFHYKKMPQACDRRPLSGGRRGEASSVDRR